MPAAPAASLGFSIDPTSQDVFPLRSLPDRVPCGRSGKKRHVSWGWRQAKDGSRAADGTIVRMPILRIGGTTYTSTEAFTWWCRRLTSTAVAAISGDSSGDPSHRRKSAEATDRQLDAAGFR